MKISPYCLFSLLPIFLLFGVSLAYGNLNLHALTGRALFEETEECQINFKRKNYTIITSRCKGPNYLAKSCCSAFKDFACPFSEAINDAKTDCAESMFSYINLRFPAGIFANMCKEGAEGLDCTHIPQAPPESPRAGIHVYNE